MDPRWILKALGLTFLVAMLCSYVVVCVLFSKQQWQLVLHPTRVLTSTPAAVGLSANEVHLSPNSSGQPQIDGWWIASDAASDPTALLLHGADGSMADALPLARALHDARLNVLVFDYRGYGTSAGAHPDQAAMESDADAAYTWLGTKGVAPANTIVVGQGLGASLATRLCLDHKAVAGMVLVDGDGDTAVRAARDTRARLVPFRWLHHEDFPLADRLSTLPTPKLLISHTAVAVPVDVQRAASPKMSFEIGPASNPAAMHEALRRFLDTYLTQAPDALTPNK